MNITTFRTLLLAAAAERVPGPQFGLLGQLYLADSLGLRSDAAKVVSLARLHRDYGHPRRSLSENLQALADEGFIDLGTVAGERNTRFSSTVRLLSDAEIVAFLGLGEAAAKGGE